MIIYQETFFVFNLYVFFHLPNPWLLMYGVLRSEQSLVGFYFPCHVNQVLGSNIALIILQPDPRPFPQRNQIRWAGPREMQSASNQKTAIETRLNREAAFLVRIKPWLKSCLITSNNYSILCSLFWSWSKLLKCIKENLWLGAICAKTLMHLKCASSVLHEKGTQKIGCRLLLNHWRPSSSMVALLFATVYLR